MSSYQRATLPENFYDITSSMLLVQPEPQYLYAQLWLGAMNASLEPGTDFGLMADRKLPMAGAPYSAAESARLMIAKSLPSDIIGAKVDFNAKPGNTIRINRPSFTNSTYTQSSRLIASGTSISTSGITISSEQTNLTLYRFGGPYSGGVVPYSIEAFDSNMGVHQAASMHGTHLKRDCHRFLDAVNIALLDQAASAVYPEGMSAVNDATASGSFPFTLEQLNRTEQLMDDANLPTFGDGFRLLVLTPTQVKQLADDPMYQRYAKFHPEFNVLFPQYVSSVGKFHVFKSTTLAQTTNSSSVAISYGHAIAPGALMGGMGRPLRVVQSTDDNYGETVKVVWLGDLAFGLADNRFVYSVRSSA